MRFFFIMVMGILLLSGCRKDEDLYKDYSYGGVWQGDTTKAVIAGTTWVLYQYKDATTTVPQQRNDTLVFISENDYLFNGNESKYNIYTVGAGGVYALSLYQTIFGSIQGNIPTSSITQGEIVNAEFKQIDIGANQTFYLWMKKI
jgi:hypothetical protein